MNDPASEEDGSYWQIDVMAHDEARQWDQTDIERVRKAIRNGQMHRGLMIDQPEVCATDDERGLQLEKDHTPAIKVTLFDYNCPEPWRASRWISVSDAKEVAKWLLKRVKEEEPSAPRRALNAVRNSIVSQARITARRLGF